MKPGTAPPLRSARLLEQMRERIRYCHYSLRTEQAYLFWVRRFIRFHRLRHPRSMGSAEVEAFLGDRRVRREFQWQREWSSFSRVPCDPQLDCAERRSL